MKTRFTALAAALVGLAVAAAATAAGPVPPVTYGSPGIAVTGGAHVVAVARQGGGATQLRLVRDRDGTVVRVIAVHGPPSTRDELRQGVAERKKNVKQKIGSR